MLQQPGKGYNSNKAVMGWITGGDMGSWHNLTSKEVEAVDLRQKHGVTSQRGWLLALIWRWRIINAISGLQTKILKAGPGKCIR
jgi:hypothetical protein